MLPQTVDRKIELIEMLLESGVSSFGKEYQEKIDRVARRRAAAARQRRRAAAVERQKRR
jgi:hypothetical protein